MVPRVSAPTPQAQVPSPDPEWQHRTLDKPPDGTQRLIHALRSCQRNRPGRCPGSVRAFPLLARSELPRAGSRSGGRLGTGRHRAPRIDAGVAVLQAVRSPAQFWHPRRGRCRRRRTLQRAFPAAAPHQVQSQALQCRQREAASRRGSRSLAPPVVCARNKKLDRPCRRSVTNISNR